MTPQRPTRSAGRPADRGMNSTADRGCSPSRVGRGGGLSCSEILTIIFWAIVGALIGQAIWLWVTS